MALRFGPRNWAVVEWALCVAGAGAIVLAEGGVAVFGCGELCALLLTVE